MDLNLRHVRAMVTGGSRGLGLAIARGLVAEGAKVAIVARDRGRLIAAKEALRSEFIDAEVLAEPADTTDDDAVRAAVDRTVAVFGGVDVLVNSAAQPAFASGPVSLHALRDADVSSDFDTKVLGYLRCARAVAPFMTAQGWGRIVNISGVNARRTGSVSGSIRNASVAALTANLADELGPSGIGVTVIHPGPVGTERTQEMLARRSSMTGRSEAQVQADIGATTSLGRFVSVAEVADVAVFLCSPRAMAITGDAVTVAGGIRGSIHY